MPLRSPRTSRKNSVTNRKLYLSTVNWGEVHYVTHRNYGLEQANKIAHIISSFPIEIVAVDLEVAKQAALFKVAHRLSYADCFAAALAKVKKSALVTGDKEFKSLEGDIKISLLG